MTDAILQENCRKWSTLPGGEERANVKELMELDDQALLDAYESWKPHWNSERGWEHERYGQLFQGRHVLELGSGLGYDAISMAPLAASWTCADILDVNLRFVSRIASLHAVQLGTSHMKDVFSHDFGRSFDGLYAHGVLHHLPFEMARSQVRNVCRFLLPGARVVLLMYPKERWEHCGRPSFEEFGAMTDGPGTPWAEWYDENKVRRLFGEEFEIIATRPWGWKNIEFVNFEMLRKGGEQ